MTAKQTPGRDDPDLPARCIGTVALSLVAALAAGVLTLLQIGCTGDAGTALSGATASRDPASGGSPSD